MITITKVLLYSIAICIATSNAAQTDGIRLANLNKPQATRCTWTPNRPAREFADPTKQIAGFLTFFNESGAKLRTVQYNPVNQTVRFTNARGQTVEKSFTRNTFKAIGEALNLNITNLDETECNKSIAEWLPAKQDSWCVIQ